MSEPEASLPSEFLERLRTIVGDAAYDQCLDHFSATLPVSLRVNPLKASPEQVISQLESLGIAVQTVDWYSDAYVVPADSRDVLVHSKAANHGWIYIQNLSSMLAPWALAPQPGETVLDLAAAPGGKATQIAAMMRNQGLLSVVEPVRTRFFKLRRVLEQQGVTLTKMYQADGRGVGTKVPERFDRVLLDAPCSSEARFRLDDPKSCAYWSPRKISEQSRKQKGLLRSAVRATKVGGRLVYATCAFAPEENEAVVNDQLRRFDDSIAIVPIDMPIPHVMPGLTEWNGKPFDSQLRHAVRVLPSGAYDPFFLCVLEKRHSTR